MAKKGPTPRRRHDVETRLRDDYATLYEQLGDANRRAADAETALALERRKVDHLNALYSAQTERRVHVELQFAALRERVEAA